jgi:hypothetical protein
LNFCLPAVGVVGACCFASGGLVSFGLFEALAFPCFLVGLVALPLCGAAPTFLCRRKERQAKESGLTPPAYKCPPFW